MCTCVLRFQSRLSDVFGVSPLQKPVVYCGRGRPPKRAIMNAANTGMSQQVYIVLSDGNRISNFGIVTVTDMHMYCNYDIPNTQNMLNNEY